MKNFQIPLNECISKSFVYIIKFEPLFEFQIFVDKSFRKLENSNQLLVKYRNLFEINYEYHYQSVLQFIASCIDYYI